MPRAGLSLLVAVLSLLMQDQQRPVFRGTLETVAVPVTVLDPALDFELVTSLTRDDFTVLDNGNPQEITTFTSGRQPVSAVVMVDVSASMMSAIDLALLAAEQLVIRLEPGDRGKVGIFSARVESTEGFSGDRDTLLRELRQTLPFSNPTRLLDAIDEGITALEPEPGRRAVVVFTDGCDTASDTTWPEILSRLYAQDVLVYAITFRTRLPTPPTRFGRQAPRGRCTLHHMLELTPATPLREFFRVDDPRWTLGPAILGRLTGVTGGGQIVLTAADDVNTTFTRLLKELRFQYLLGFSPAALDGKVHEITVRVNDPKLIVRARSNYVAPLPPDGGGGSSPR